VPIDQVNAVCRPKQLLNDKSLCYLGSQHREVRGEILNVTIPDQAALHRNRRKKLKVTVSFGAAFGIVVYGNQLQ
jgi:hypothetical protein